MMDDLRGTFTPHDLDLDFPAVDDRPRRPRPRPVRVDVKQPRVSAPMVLGGAAVAIALLAGLVGFSIGGAKGADATLDALKAKQETENLLGIEEDYSASLEASVTALETSVAALASEVESATEGVEFWRQRAEDASITISALERDVDGLTSKLKQQKAAPAPKKPSPIKTSYSTKGVEQWRPLVAKYFKAANVDAALSVMRKESGGNPAATNKSSGCAGLFQIHPCHLAKFKARTGTSDLHDPEANIKFAAYMSNYGSNWSSWVAQP